MPNVGSIFDSFDKVIIDHLTVFLFIIGFLVIKKKKLELDRKGDMNTIIHDITYEMHDKR